MALMAQYAPSREVAGASARGEQLEGPKVACCQVRPTVLTSHEVGQPLLQDVQLLPQIAHMFLKFAQLQLQLGLQSRKLLQLVSQLLQVMYLALQTGQLLLKQQAPLRVIQTAPADKQV